MCRLRSLAVLVVAMGPLLAPAEADPKPPAEKLITNSIGIKLTLIPPGKFRMGSPDAEAERDDEELQHEVTLTRPFYMGVHEVTQGQYQQVMGRNPSWFNPQNGGSLDHPVENVRWPFAVEFCKKLSARPDEQRAGRAYRLPTEAEWEYACRAGTSTPFHYGNGLSSKQANFNGSSPYGAADKGPYLARTARVGSYPPNAFGLHDMHGNVCEFCADWYDPAYYKSSPPKDPLGPPKGVVATGYKNEFFVVVRGGSWLDEARACRSAYRFRHPSQDTWSRLTGFRVVCAVPVVRP
jgi:formylglycine-generating enzyme required for sulfatase activity